jgi:hypothetical protein
MVEKPPGNEGASQQDPKRHESETPETRRRAVVGKLKVLMDEERKLISGPLTEASLGRLTEINRQEASLIDQVGVIERHIAARQRSQ